jgi:hypothetical protein
MLGRLKLAVVKEKFEQIRGAKVLTERRPFGRRCAARTSNEEVAGFIEDNVRIKAFKLICGIIVAKLLRANGGCLGVK